MTKKSEDKKPRPKNGESDDRVFIKTGIETYDVVSIDDAAKDCIILCYNCNHPARSLDHYWPYHSEMNGCNGKGDCNEKEIRTK